MAELRRGAAGLWLFKMVNATDKATPELGKSPTVYFSKDGGNWATSTNAASELGAGDAADSGGWYKVAVTTAERTCNEWLPRAEAAGCAQADESFYLPTYTITSQTAVEFTSPVVENNDVELYYGDDYEGTEGLSMAVSDYDRYDLTDAIGAFRLLERAKWDQGGDTEADLELTGADCTIAQDGTDVTITVAVEGTDFTGLLTQPPKPEHFYRYQVVATTSEGTGSKEVTLLEGDCTIKKKITAIPAG